ncbi:DNA cytosine methyltransferase [Aliarcobacter skirrowii]|uniref:Cytosine-specific methyltransferase n=1 Tax=Aliarcobacter skirrowii CCUG 10374 TaxID=1032239 RepID=A0AAD0SMX5_9BACT|nr:DNA cytosine methyltransferase [Aliarcobacter skirrowii]AXX85096.1 type IIP restriction/modification system, cytosine-specific DNA methyltransferase [Aliarcobacter skirrowii CCUG 10374]KAB0620745.1 DNA cytosine methyltransferase [Aliarcobacter skirrowii CCUG 10374]RXI25909.1 DNA (cytosine-5-)-methyltransferase [Aliarcobacter skirrowii CCUG 10374]SUU96378.1 Modification methylase BspRI [Aliarcobacter skirrowii]
MDFKIFSTFTGAGGLDIGFHGDFDFLGKYFPKLPFTTEYALEYNKDAINSLDKNKKYFKNTKLLHKDITENIEKEILKYKPNEYDIFLGGFPCVTFSVVGKQEGIKNDKDGQLYESFAKYVERLQPKVFIAENVKGILSANKGEAVKIIKKRFELDGYKLKIFLVNFADFGVPQLRERVLFIGIRNDIKTEFIPPEFTHKNNHITSKEAFKNLPKNCVHTQHLKVSEKVVERLKLIPQGKNFKAVENTPYAVKGLMSNIYRRLHEDEPAYTVIASGGGGTWGYHFKENRPLTNRERARLQSFPDDYNFQGSTTEVRRQIGNAVPPVGIYPFAQRITSLLKGETPQYNPNNCIKEYDVELKKFI